MSQPDRMQSPRRHCLAGLVMVMLTGLSGACQGGDVFNPGDPASTEYYLTQALLCALGDASCVTASSAGNAGGESPCTQSFMGGNIIGCELAFQNGMNVTTPYGPAQGSTTAGDADAAGNAASFNRPYNITTDGTSLYLVEFNQKIRRIDIATGVVTTLAGPAPGTTGSGDTDGIGHAARFNSPTGITTDGVNLYVVDTGNHKIRKVVIATGEVTTLAGPAPGSSVTGDTDAPGTGARFNQPQGLTTDGTKLYVAGGDNNKIRAID